MTLIGSASIQIRADDKYFEPDVRRAVAKIKNVAIKLKADVDIAAASKKIRDLRYRITSKDAVLQVDADTAKAEAKFQKLFEAFADRDVQVTARANTAEADAALAAMAGRSAVTGPTVTANANTLRAEAQLALLARDRKAKVDVQVPPDVKAALQGFMNTLSGTLPVDKIRSAVLSVVENFEGMAVSGAKLGSVITALGAVAATTGANILSLGADVAQTGLLVTLLPTAVVTLTAVLKANKFAWEDFGTAARDNSAGANEALAKLPPLAQDAAVALRGAREEIQQSAQNNFWDSVNTSLQEMSAEKLPSVITGMGMVGRGLGLVYETIFDTVKGLADFNDIFDNIETGLGNLSEGIGGVVEGLFTFAAVGSSYLPKFGTYLSDLSEKFGRFAERAAASGDMVQWMDTGIRRLQELGSVASSTISTFRGLSDAAKLSGAPGLTEFADGFARVAEIVNGEPFQSRLVAVLEGARSGTDAMGEAFGRLTTFIANSSDSISAFLELGGQIGGLVFDNITALFDGTGLGSGLYDALQGAKTGLAELEVGFANFGTMIGDLGEISGVLFEQMAPGLNMLAETLAGVVAGLKDGIIAAMPVLNEFVQAMLGLVQGPVIALAEGIGNILEAFASLPGGVQTAIAAFGLFLLLKPRIDALFGAIRTGSQTAFARIATDTGGGITSMGNLSGSMDRVRAAWGRVGSEIGAAKIIGTLQRTGDMAGSVSGRFERLGIIAGTTAGAIGRTAGEGLRMAGGGLMNLLGGPLGAALAVGAVAVGLYAKAQADAKARVDELSASLDQQTGAATGATKKIIIGDLLDFNSGQGKIESFFRFGQKTASESMESIGLDIQDVADKLSDPAASAAYIDSWSQISDKANNFQGISEELAASVGLTADELNSLSSVEVSNLANAAMRAGEEFTKAQEAVVRVANATGENTIQAARLSANYETLASTTSSASEKFSALKSNLDILNGGTMTASDAQAKYAQSTFDTSAALTELSTRQGVMMSALVSTNGAWDMSTQAGVDFYTTMQTASDGILENATSVYDAALKQGATVEEASRKAVQSTQEPIAALTASLAGLGLSQTQIEGVTAALGLVPTDIQAALSVQGAEDAQQKIFYTTVAAQAFASGNYSALLAALPDEAKMQIESATGLAGAFADGNYDAILRALDDTEMGRTGALASLGSVADGDFSAEIKAIDFTPPTVNQAQNLLDSIRAETVAIKATDQTGPVVGAAQAVVNSLKGKNVDAGAINKAQAEVDAAQAKVNSMKGKNVDVKAINLAQAAVDSAQGAVNSFKGKKVNAEVNNLAAGPMGAAQGTVNSFRGKTVDARVNNLAPGPVGAAQGSVNSFFGKTVALNVTTNAGPIALAAQQSINNVQGKTVVITTRNETVYGGSRAANADGGLYTSSGTRVFANGGIMDGARNRAVKSFANGGMENHTAQIARGAWPVRIWAEPETGGEAYLPLAKSKRKRSLEILKVVMAEFGIQGFKDGKAFANGGFNMPNTRTPALVSARSGAQGTSLSPTRSTSMTAPSSQPVIIVQPSQGLSEAQIGEAAANEWFWQSTNR